MEDNSAAERYADDVANIAGDIRGPVYARARILKLNNIPVIDARDVVEPVIARRPR